MLCKSVVFVTLEYCENDLFSGNGICARSQVRRLASSIQVHVICGRPRWTKTQENPSENISLTTVPLDIWFSTDRDSSHAQFANAVANILNQVDWSKHDACLAVDWTGTNPLREMRREITEQMSQRSIPIIYLNLRSYMSMTNISDSDRQFYTEAEHAAVQLALTSSGSVISLCKSDDNVLQKLAPEHLKDNHKRFHVLLPMLRSEFSKIAQIDKDKILNAGRKRTYLACLVRLSEDKGAHRFVGILKLLHKMDPYVWEREKVVPLLLGAPNELEYAEKVRAELKNSVPNAVVIDTFLRPQQLAAILQDAVLNIHPALYEAYGMTIVEAAAMGCPSIVHNSGIGATQLLPSGKNASIAVDLRDELLVVKKVMHLLGNRPQLASIAQCAYKCANSWTEEEYGQDLVRLVNEAIVRSNGCQT